MLRKQTDCESSLDPAISLRHGVACCLALRRTRICCLTCMMDLAFTRPPSNKASCLPSHAIAIRSAALYHTRPPSAPPTFFTLLAALPSFPFPSLVVPGVLKNKLGPLPSATIWLR